MSIGKMRHRISLQTIVPSVNDNGFETDNPQIFKTVWAAVTNLHGKEFFEAQALQSEKTVKFTIRYLAGLDTSMQVVFEGKTYNITAIDHIKYRKGYIEIRALEVDSNG